MKNNDKAIELLNKCIDDYTGYLNENYIHFKTYAALRELGLCTAKQGTDHNKRMPIIIIFILLVTYYTGICFNFELNILIYNYI